MTRPVCPNCGFHLTPTLFGSSAPAARGPAAVAAPPERKPAHTSPTTAKPHKLTPDASSPPSPPPDPTRGVNVALARLRKAQQAPAPTPEQMAELRALRGREKALGAK